MKTTKQKVLVYVTGAVLVGVTTTVVILLASARAAGVKHESEERTQTVQAGPRVKVVRVHRTAHERTLELQGEARPFASVTLFAKLSGYLKEIRVDRGDRVKAGQPLATIESPELDRQYEAAVADAKYKRADAHRAANLAGPGVVSARDAELAATGATVAESQVATLATQKSYEILRAPFNGVVTARFADPGALVQNASNSQTSALPVLTVSQPDKLRIFVYVDQSAAWAVHPGDLVSINPPERPDVVVEGKVTRITGELDPRSRTMAVEVDVDNRKSVIVPGSFVAVTLKLHLPDATDIPAEALIVQNQKTFAAVVSSDGHVHLKAVSVATLDGTRVALTSGLAEGDLVALNLGKNINEGDRVQPLFEETSEPARHP